MPKFYLIHYYTAKEGFTIEADSLEQAKEISENGDVGERDFDEYLEVTREVIEDADGKVLFDSDRD